MHFLPRNLSTACGVLIFIIAAVLFRALYGQSETRFGHWYSLALALAHELAPDVRLMDVNLGEMDGIEATRIILTQEPEIKVIGLSMHIDEGVANAMRTAGAVDYLTKGGPSEDLIAAIRSCVA